MCGVTSPPQRQVGAADGNIVLDLFILHQRIGELMEVALDGTDVRPAEYAVYTQLGRGPLTPRELCVRLGVTPSTLTGHLAALQRRNHIDRVPDPADGRSYRVVLTTAGEEEVARCRKGFRRMLARLRRHLSVDEASSRELLRAIDESALAAIESLRSEEDRPRT